jgi:hypothetical protein
MTFWKEAFRRSMLVRDSYFVTGIASFNGHQHSTPRKVGISIKTLALFGRLLNPLISAESESVCLN